MNPRSAKKSGNCAGESPPPLNEKPGKCGEELPSSALERNPPRIAIAQAAAAAIQVIRTAARPANLISDGPFTMTQCFALPKFWGVGFLPRAAVRCIPPPSPVRQMLDLDLNLRVGGGPRSALQPSRPLPKEAPTGIEPV
jgi:hypothetical protein